MLCTGSLAVRGAQRWDRTLLDGKTGATIWCGHAVFAHNLVKISALAS